jgi:hypothetical protein
MLSSFSRPSIKTNTAADCRDLPDLFGGSPRLLVSNLLENGALTLRDLKALQSAARSDKNGHARGGKRA